MVRLEVDVNLQEKSKLPWTWKVKLGNTDEAENRRQKNGFYGRAAALSVLSTAGSSSLPTNIMLPR